VKIATSVEQGKNEFASMRVAVEKMGGSVDGLKATLDDVHSKVTDLHNLERPSRPITFQRR
jgi:hypothetical protein